MEMADTCRDSTPTGSNLMPWLVCFSASLFFFYEFIQGNMFASIADDIMRDFSIRADRMAWLSSIYYLSNVLFLFVAGILLDRFSTKRTIVIAMGLCVVSTFVLAHANTLSLALACRFITGIGSAFCFLGPIRIASRWFPPQRMALVTGAVVTMAMTGGMLAQYPLTRLVASFGWRDALVMVGWLGVGMLVIMMLCIRDKPEHAKEPRHTRTGGLFADARKAWLAPQPLRAALYTSLMNMAVAVYGSMMGSLYMVQRLGIDKEGASAINTMLFLGAIIGGPFIGWCSDRMRLRVLPMKAGVIASLLVVLAIIFLPVSATGMAVLFFLLGFFTAAQVISYALVAESSSPAITATAVSLISILTQGGYIIYQNLFSTLLVAHGGMQMQQGAPVYTLAAYQSASLMLPIGLIIALLALFGLRETHCRHVPGV